MSPPSAAWKKVTLGEICEFRYGKSLPEAARAGGRIPVFGSNGQVGLHDEALTSGPTIIIGRKGSFGEVNFSQVACWPIDTTYYVDESATNADLRWLSYRLAALGLTTLNRAAAVPGLNREDAYRQPLLLPPVAEQRRIAAILDQADALRTKRRTAIAHLDALAQSIFLDMFGDPATNPKGWPRRSLADVFDIARGGSPRPIDDFITESPDGINWVMIGDASEGGGKYISRTRKRIKPEGARRSRAVKPGDFLLTNSMSFGRPYIMKTSGCIHDGWLVLSPRDGTFVSEYFYRLLGSSAVYAEFVRLAPGATVKNLNIDLVRSVEVPVAPTDRQLEFPRRADALERVRDSLLTSLAALNEQFLALQGQAFADDAFSTVEAR